MAEKGKKVCEQVKDPEGMTMTDDERKRMIEEVAKLECWKYREGEDELHYNQRMQIIFEYNLMIMEENLAAWDGIFSRRNVYREFQADFGGSDGGEPSRVFRQTKVGRGPTEAPIEAAGATEDVEEDLGVREGGPDAVMIGSSDDELVMWEEEPPTPELIELSSDDEGHIAELEPIIDVDPMQTDSVDDVASATATADDTSSDGGDDDDDPDFQLDGYCERSDRLDRYAI